MPRVGGVYSLPLPPVDPGDAILSSWANTSLDDLALAMDGSLATDGSNGMVGSFSIADGTGVSDPGLNFTTETSSGLWKAAAGDVRGVISGTDVIRLNNDTVTMKNTGDGTWYGILNLGNSAPVPTTATTGQILEWSGSAWMAVDSDVTLPTGTDGQILIWDTGAWAASDYTPVPGTGITTDQILQWNGSAWVPVDYPSAGLPSATEGQIMRYQTGVWASVNYEPLPLTTATGNILQWDGDSWEGIGYAPMPLSASPGQIVTWSGTAWDATNYEALPTSATTGNMVTWNGSSWVATTYVPVPSATTGQTLEWSGGAWTAVDNAALPSGSAGETLVNAGGTNWVSTDTLRVGTDSVAINPLAPFGNVALGVRGSGTEDVARFLTSAGATFLTFDDSGLIIPNSIGSGTAASGTPLYVHNTFGYIYRATS